MPINLPDLPNGLKQINTGITPGDGQGDAIRTFADKVNLNTQITLTQNDNIAGPGLRWDSSTRKLRFAGSSNQVLIGDGYVPLGAEFSIVGGTLRLQNLDGSKIIGTIRPENVLLSDRQVAVGLGGVGQAYALSSEFSLTGGEVSIANLAWSKVSSVAVTPSQISLAANKIAVGSASGSEAITLGPDFTISGDEGNRTLSITVSNQLVTLGSISATGASVGRVLAIKGPANAMSLEWVTVNSGGGGGGGTVTPGSVGVTSFNTTNQSSPRAVIQVDASGDRLEWVPDLRNRVEAAGRAYANFLADQQRRINLDYARSIAELQNRSCEVYNYKMPAVYTANIGIPQKIAPLPGGIYIAGGHGAAGFSLNIERLDIQTDTLKVLSSTPSLTATSGEKYNGLHFNKQNPTSVASPSNMYITGWSVDSSPQWRVEKFNFVRQAATIFSQTLGTAWPCGGATVGDSLEGFFIGGVQNNQQANPTHITSTNSVVELVYTTDTLTSLSYTLSGSTFNSTAETTYNTNSIGYIFGGVSATAATAAVQKFTMAATPTLTAVSAVSMPDHNFAAASFADAASAYLFGGAPSISTSFVGSTSGRIFNFAQETFTTNNINLQAKRYGMSGSASDRKGYLFGGTMTVSKSTVVETYSENIPVWSERIIPEIRTVQNVAGQSPLYRYNG